MTIRKALITAAGFGTRFLPITKSIQKEMLPVLNRPLVDYVVEDCIKAGITDIVFIISEHNRQLLHYYSENKRLQNYLVERGKSEFYSQVEPIHQQANFTFIKQSDNDPYGTAVPVKLAQEQLQDEEAFIVFMGDDFIFNSNGVSETASLIETFNNSGAEALATCLEKPADMLHKYGVAEVADDNGFSFLKRLVEKPAPGTAPSNLANISKYIFTPKIFEIIEKQAPNQESGELYITDSISILAQEAKVVIHKPEGKYLDAGYVSGWLQANLEIAKNNPELRAEIEEYLKSEWFQ